MKEDPNAPEREVTRRELLVKGGVLVGSVAATALLYRGVLAPPRRRHPGAPLPADVIAPGTPERFVPEGEADKPTPYRDITNYNNFYEFSTDKYAVAELAERLVVRPWTVTVDGLVGKPKVWDVDELLRRFRLEERIYRHRCVEGWSMVIPWMGFELRRLLAEAEPLSSARYVAFESSADPKRLVGLGDALPWPYREGLRLDEAMHPLTILAGGLYGETLPGQDGAPLRLAVPWKYGFKSAKSIVRISLVDREPPTTWNHFAPNEYGFTSNVNPDVPHPRWSQARERRIGEVGKRETLLYNGYGKWVASLYTGMDLRRDF